MDLVDMSDVSRANGNYKYLTVGVDVFSRVAFVVRMKNKQMSSIIESGEEVLDNTSPNIINGDNGSEFTNHLFKKFIRDRGMEINYVDVGDHHKSCNVDRFVRTLRENIAEYCTMHNTTKYIDVYLKLFTITIMHTTLKLRNHLLM